MAMKLYTESSVQNIADAIRTKNGLSTTYKVAEMAQAVLDLPAGNTKLGLVTKEQRDLSVARGSYTTIGDWAFYNCSLLTKANFPECTTIGSNAFYSCVSLSSISFPKCTSIGDYAFIRCLLNLANFPKCTTIGSLAFDACYSLTEANFPVCTTIRNTAFANCSSLTLINFPKCEIIQYGAFQSCSLLTEANFPECTTIGSTAFRSCSSLTKANLPKCVSLTGSSIFQSCRSLSKLTLGTSNCVLTNTNTFLATPMSLSTYLGYFGSIYVPSEYLSYYISATNWSRYSSRIVGY